MLALADWVIIGGYLVFALVVGLLARERASEGRHSYFIASRSLPWWWAGTSIAATTFAADTPLAITGIVAERGLSGNWIWLSWMLVHAGVVVVFARRWWRTGVVTDAEFIAIRYGGRGAGWLRSFRAGLYGLVYNAIILGWVLRAMGKIVQPIFPWQEWLPGVTATIDRIIPAQSPITGAEAITILILVVVVALYSSLGGIRGVIQTDLVQFAFGLVGGIWLAVEAWQAVGGQAGLQAGLAELYGGEAAGITSLFPDLSSGWAAALGLSAFTFGAYLLVQSYANVPADGGGYLQQRLNTARSEDDAQKAAGLFFFLQYVVRVWPWFIVALAALVLIPVGGEAAGGEFAAMVADDREMAYPALMFELLPAGVLGLLVASLLAAFMSTIDTHFNWGASYVVSDVALRLRPALPTRRQVLVARLSVIGFAVLAVLVAFQIERIEQAWRWVAALGAALGLPTVLRWIWWRMSAAAEVAGAVAGLLMAGGLQLFGDVPYELQLLWISGTSLLGVAAGVLFGPSDEAATVERFQATVEPIGFWPGRSRGQAARQLAVAGAKVLALAVGAVGMIMLMKTVLLGA